MRSILLDNKQFTFSLPFFPQSQMESTRQHSPLAPPSGAVWRTCRSPRVPPFGVFPSARPLRSEESSLAPALLHDYCPPNFSGLYLLHHRHCLLLLSFYQANILSCVSFCTLWTSCIKILKSWISVWFGWNCCSAFFQNILLIATHRLYCRYLQTTPAPNSNTLLK